MSAAVCCHCSLTLADNGFSADLSQTVIPHNFVCFACPSKVVAFPLPILTVFVTTAPAEYFSPAQLYTTALARSSLTQRFSTEPCQERWVRASKLVRLREPRVRHPLMKYTPVCPEMARPRIGQQLLQTLHAAGRMMKRGPADAAMRVSSARRRGFLPSISTHLLRKFRTVPRTCCSCPVGSISLSHHRTDEEQSEPCSDEP